MSLCDICHAEPVKLWGTQWLHTSPALGSQRLCAGCALSNPDAVCPCCLAAMRDLVAAHGRLARPK